MKRQYKSERAEKNTQEKMIKSRFKAINIKDMPTFTDEEIAEKGLIFAPYIPMMRISCKEQYEKEHACCPKCGSKETFPLTTIGIGFFGKIENVKDINECLCSLCGDKHIIHDRVEGL